MRARRGRLGAAPVPGWSTSYEARGQERSAMPGSTGRIHRVPDFHAPRSMNAADASILAWEEGGQQRQARWRSEAGWPAPARVQLADDQTPADLAYRLACEGTALLWRGDFKNARQLLQALGRRLDRPARKAVTAPASPAEAFHRHRQAQGRRARVLGMVVIAVDGEDAIRLRRAPDLRAAMGEAWGPADGQPCVVALRECLGLVGAQEGRGGAGARAAAGQPHPRALRRVLAGPRRVPRPGRRGALARRRFVGLGHW